MSKRKIVAAAKRRGLSVVFGSWRGNNSAITHYAAEPAGPRAA